MNEERNSWQELLKKIIKDVSERRRIAEALGKTMMTLMRWSNGESIPRQDNIVKLIDAIPTQYQEEMRDLLMQAFPQYFPDEQDDDGPSEAPANFYVSLMYAYSNSLPNLRKEAVSSTIFQQVLSLLDPRNLGMTVTIHQCVAPSKHNVVRSLRRTMGRGTHPWPTHLSQQILFLGAESPVGLCANSHRPVLVQSPEEHKDLFPLHKEALAKSEYACPILLGDTLAGVLQIASVHPHFFTDKRQELARYYASAATLAFASKEFYTIQQVRLVIMPSYERQQPALGTYPERSRRIHLEATYEGRSVNFEEAQNRAWQEIEEALTSLPSEEDFQ